MKRHTTLWLILALALPAALTGAADSILPDSDLGRRAAAYLEAFNSGSEDAMRAFIEANVSKASLAQRPIEERLAGYRAMRDEHHTLTPVRLVASLGSEIKIVARTGSRESLHITFLFGSEPPYELLGLRVVSSGPGGGEARPIVSNPLPDDQAVAAWRTHLDSLSRVDEFSGAVLLAKGDEVLFQSAYGHASRKDRIANRTDTKFNLGSINKMFTKLAIAQLVEQGKIELDATIDRYLPDYPKQVASRVTVQQLLEHRGGVGDIFGDEYDRADHSKLRKVADWIPLFRDKPLAFEPGSAQEYSNGGYVLLGAIVEKVSGEDYYDYVRRHVYQPLGMRNTDHYADDERVANRATGYTRRGEAGGTPDPSGWAANSRSRPMRGSPAGGGYSTLEDLLTFTRAVRAGKLIRPETVRDFRELGPGPGGEVGIGFGGGAPGINAAVEVNGPYTIIVLANLDPPAASDAAQKLSQWLPSPQGSGVRRVRVPHRGHDASSAATPAEGVETVRRVRGSDAPDRTSVSARGVEVQMLASGHLPAVYVRVNGKGPFLFAIDTGGGHSATVDSALAVQLGLEKLGQVRTGDPSGLNTRLVDRVRVESIEIGGARFEGLSCSARTMREGPPGEAVQGILGFALFRDCLLTLDYPARKVLVERGELGTAQDEDVIPFTLRHGIPSVQLMVGSLTVDADVDAGSPAGLSLPVLLADQLTLAGPLRIVGKGRTVSNEFEIQAAELKGIARLGRHEFVNPMLDFQPIFPMANVGSRVLRDFRVTFDQKNGRMRLQRVRGS